MKQRLRAIMLILLTVLTISMLSGCTVIKWKAEKVWRYVDKTFLYDEDWIIGKNSNEIQEKYGEFYSHGTEDEDGLIRNGWGEYITAVGVPDINLYMFIAPNADEYYRIHFDENGLAGIWSISDEQLLTLLNQTGYENSIFGLDFPYKNVKMTKDAIQRIKSLPISEEAKAAILGDNLARALNI